MIDNNQLITLEGWYVYHDFRRIDFSRWKEVSETERQQALEELFQFMYTWEENEAEKKGSTSLFSVLGHKADLVFIYLRPKLDELYNIKTTFHKMRLADFMEPTESYISVVELSNYVNRPGQDPKADPRVRARLYPTLPKEGYMSFYPMNKKREGADNWYTLSMEKRRELMKSHGMIGRKYAGKVQQMISGSIGFDDWEWGVTLFAQDPLQFKYIVYEMRFDEASARYGDFGYFTVGHAMNQQKLKELLHIE